MRVRGKPVSCCFTGHRPAKLPWRTDESDERCLRLKARLREVIARAVEGRLHALYLRHGGGLLRVPAAAGRKRTALIGRLKRGKKSEWRSVSCAILHNPDYSSRYAGSLVIRLFTR